MIVSFNKCLSNRVVISALEDKRQQLIDMILSRKHPEYKTLKQQNQPIPQEWIDEANNLIDQSNRADPTGALGVYTPWIVKQILLGNLIFPEDEEKVKEKLMFLEEAKKRRNKEIETDINKYKTYGDLAEIIEKTKGKPLSKHHEIEIKEQKGEKIIYNDARITIIEVSTPEAAAKWGKDTEWCTKVPKVAVNYLRSGNLYVVLLDGRKFAQIHFPSKQMKDVRDVDIEIEEYLKIRDALKGVFSEYISVFSVEKACEIMVDKKIDWSKTEDMMLDFANKMIDDILDVENLETYFNWIIETINKKEYHLSFFDMPSYSTIQDGISTGINEIYNIEGRGDYTVGEVLLNYYSEYLIEKFRDIDIIIDSFEGETLEKILKFLCGDVVEKIGMIVFDFLVRFFSDRFKDFTVMCESLVEGWIEEKIKEMKEVGEEFDEDEIREEVYREFGETDGGMIIYNTLVDNLKYQVKDLKKEVLKKTKTIVEKFYADKLDEDREQAREENSILKRRWNYGEKDYSGD